MNLELTAYEPISVAKIAGMLHLILGFVMGLVYAGIGMTMSDVLMESSSMMSFMFGIGGVLVMPLVYGIMGFIIGILCALFYNWLAGRIGGIEMTFVESD